MHIFVVVKLSVEWQVEHALELNSRARAASRARRCRAQFELGPHCAVPIQPESHFYPLSSLFNMAHIEDRTIENTTIDRPSLGGRSKPGSRRGSGSVVLKSGQTLAYHTRTNEEDDLPHATKKYFAVL